MSIGAKAMLVKLSISQWCNQITDNKIANEVASKYEVSKQEDKYVKTLIPRVALREITRGINDLRLFHYNNTLPWQDDSVRILASSNFFEYQEGITARRAWLETAVERFAENYPKWLEHARETKKGLFDETQYPSAAGITQQYKVNVTFLPFPDVGDFRVELDAETIASIKEETKHAIAKALNIANQNLIDRLHEKARVLYTSLIDPDKIFRDATVFAVHETAEFISQLNVTENPRITAAADMANTIMNGVTPDALRTNPKFRLDTAARLADLLTALGTEDVIL